MVERLDAPQPTFILPPLDQIPDEAENDKAHVDNLLTTRFGPLNIPAIVFGAASFSAFYNSDDHVSGVEPLRATRLALRYGICAFDTSPYYGPSEIILGNALKALEKEFPRESYKLITKCGRYGNGPDGFNYTAEGVRASIQRSLKRLHTSYLDVVYLHDVEFVAESKLGKKSGNHLAALGTEKVAYGLEEGSEGNILGEGDEAVLNAIAELRKLKQEGIIRNVGISGFPLPTLLRLALLIKEKFGEPLDIIMSYSHLTLQNRTVLDFKDSFIQRAGVKQVVTASPFSMGLLNPKPPVWHPAPENIKIAVAAAVKRCSQWSEKGDSGLPDLALEFSMERARQAEMPNVVGLSTLKDVHTSAAVWHNIERGICAKEDWNAHVQEVTTLFAEHGVLDLSWETPKSR
ncbi:Aldo/keto reductase family-domain-containing protein [Hygrophoropsis aurantiaca]|uniref:Aldo/keto reductase family-domain-containing protein n=1 Tax=Hygrophoropsis aurantiaca TaxID=72124 RepID=A0ACB8AV91_9AGAM|nr:Aldo/keto reductase family-domain-containing protein [Hygrophoropsis aurantiaca]